MGCASVDASTPAWRQDLVVLVIASSKYSIFYVEWCHLLRYSAEYFVCEPTFQLLAGFLLVWFSTLKMEVIRSSETSVHMRNTKRHIPEDDNIQTIVVRTSITIYFLTLLGHFVSISNIFIYVIPYILKFVTFSRHLGNLTQEESKWNMGHQTGPS
jgi:hypothetical protein